MVPSVSRCLKPLVKHSHSFLIYYMKNYKFLTQDFFLSPSLLTQRIAILELRGGGISVCVPPPHTFSRSATVIVPGSVKRESREERNKAFLSNQNIFTLNSCAWQKRTLSGLHNFIRIMPICKVKRSIRGSGPQ